MVSFLSAHKTVFTTKDGSPMTGGMNLCNKELQVKGSRCFLVMCTLK